MNKDDPRKRTKQFALCIVKLVAALPKTVEGRVIANPIMKAGTSVGANYRAACRARSRAEFIAKPGIVEEEADESGYRMERIVEGELLSGKRLAPLLSRQAEEILAIVTASRKSAKAKKGR